MGARETMLKWLREVSDQQLAGAFDFEGGVELLATLRADLQEGSEDSEEDVPLAQMFLLPKVARV